MAQSSEHPYHSLQLVRKNVDGNQVLVGHEELYGKGFDMVARSVDRLLLFNFDPTDKATREAGVLALLTLLVQTPTDQRVVFVSPGSNKSEGMVQEVVEAYRKQTGIDHQLFIFEKSAKDPSLRQGGFDGQVQDYIPVTSPDTPRFLAMTAEQEVEIKQAVDAGAVVVVLDDIVSTGATLEAIETLLRHIGVSVEQRLAVGAEYPAELVEKQGDRVVWRPKTGLPKPKLEVQTAFVLPLFAGEDAVTIMERS